MVSGFPDVNGAAAVIVQQADEVLVKPFNVKKVAELIREKKRGRHHPLADKESVASIPERNASITIERWLARVRLTKELIGLTLADEERTEYLPEIIEDIAVRLRKVRVIEVIRVPSYAVMARGGQLRCRQGYVAPLIVQESQILQVSLFETIQRNLARLDFGAVLTDIMLIADQVDSQLTQTIHSFLTDAGGRGGRLRKCRTMSLSSPAQIPLLVTEN